MTNPTARAPRAEQTVYDYGVPVKTLVRRRATWTYDEEAHAYYFAIEGRTPSPYLNQREVTAIIDIAGDGTFAGIELAMGDYPAPPASALAPSPPAPAGVREEAQAVADKLDAAYKEWESDTDALLWGPQRIAIIASALTSARQAALEEAAKIVTGLQIDESKVDPFDLNDVTNHNAAMLKAEAAIRQHMEGGES